ncbi:MAG: zf-HC2 domain-containing protein [Treponema sp.]|jgi:anti-sigma factor RsiW|nr:zf-HC2 domain-containing protein [Treponema sp.]
MCPDPQLLSIYLDGELPSPWKEKMEAHLTQCPECGKKLENFQRLHGLFKKDTRSWRTVAERGSANTGAEDFLSEPEMEAAKDRVWRKMEFGRRFNSRSRLWQRRLSIPLPAAAAAAAVIIAILAAVWIRGGLPNLSPNPVSIANIILASEEEEMPGIIPAADMNGVLQYLGSDGTDIIVLRLPESRNFNRSGEPTIVKAADYSRRRP